MLIQNLICQNNPFMVLAYSLYLKICIAPIMWKNYIGYWCGTLEMTNLLWLQKCFSILRLSLHEYNFILKKVKIEFTYLLKIIDCLIKNYVNLEDIKDQKNK